MRNGGGFGLRAGLTASDFTKIPCSSCKGGTFNDNLSSWLNNGNTRYCWWINANFLPSNGGHTMPPGQLVNVSLSENDTASSAAPC